MKTLMALKTCVVAAVAAIGIGARADEQVASPYATGGEVSVVDETDYVHVFTNGGTFTTKVPLTARILVVGGGGSGGGCIGGGGGAAIEQNDVMLTPGVTYTVTVGAGGQTAGNNWNHGKAGEASSLIGGTVSITAAGGGYGGGWSQTAGGDGACGGGATCRSSSCGKGTIANGGISIDQSDSNAIGGAGGGGASGEDGKNSGNKFSGAGGAGYLCDITGDELDYGSGGGGGTGNSVVTPGEAGGPGGGTGVKHNAAYTTGNALDGRGGGGGGGAFNSSNTGGGAGGSGTVIVRYAKPAAGTVIVSSTMGEVGTVSPAYGHHTDLQQGKVVFEATATEEFLNAEETVRARCTGWTLSDISGTVLRTSEDQGESPFACEYDYSTGAGAILTWQWIREFKVTASASGNGSVDVDEQWVAEGGSITLTATAEEGNTFVRWTGNLDDSQILQNPLTVDPVAEPLALTALFKELGAPATWNGSAGDGLASTGDNWSTGLPPATGDKVILDGTCKGDLVWDLPGVVPASWTQTADYSGTVTFATTYAEEGEGAFPLFEVSGDVTIAGGKWTHKKNEAAQTYRLNVKIGGNLTVAADAESGVFGAINVTDKGFAKGKGRFPAPNSETGGSYGGSSSTTGEKCYGSIKRPVDLGSGSNPTYNGNDAHAGGAVKIIVAGDALIDGKLLADGGYISGHASSAGGSVWLTAAHITGAGQITANGANPSSGWPATGGGGRISLVQTADDSTYDSFTGEITARQRNNYQPEHAGAGTIYEEVAADGGRGRLTVRNVTSTLPNGFTELNTLMEQDFDFGEIRLLNYANLRVQPGVTLNLDGVKMTGDGTGRLYLTGADSITLPDEYTWTNVNVCCVGEGATFAASEKTTVGEKATITCGAYPINVPGDLYVSDGGAITHFGVGSTGQQKVDLFVEGNLVIDETSMIHAHNSGMSEYTTGRNETTGSSSHGGLGEARAGYTYRDLPLCYGSIHNPLDYGSKGHIDQGGYGGGVVRLNVGGKLTVDGLISASATTSPYQGGSGGSVNITCGEIDGTGAWEGGWGGIWAQGSQRWHGGDTTRNGGGGRIAITLTGAEATMANFTGHLSARGLGSTGYSGVYKPAKAYFSNAGSPRYGGAGTIYLREKNAAVDEGTLIIDNDATLATTAAGAITQINAEKMEGFSYGKVVLRNGGRLWVKEGVTIETSAFENDAEKPGLLMSDPLAVVKIVGDAEGNAYISGDVEFSTLVIDPSVTKLVVATGVTVTVTTSLTAVGSEGNLIGLESSDPEGTFNLNVSAAASTSLDYLRVKNCVATGAKLAPEHSEGEGNTDGWKFVTIEPGMEITWTGLSSDSWSDAGNWDVERVPVKTDFITIPAGTEHMPTLPQVDVTVGKLTVAAGASLTLNGFALTVDGDLDVRGALVATANEAITVKGNLTLAKTTAFVPAISTLTLANTEAVTAGFAGKGFYRVCFAGTGRVAVSGGFDSATLEIAEGADLTFAGSYAATVLRIAGTEAQPAVLASAVTGEKWNLTLRGYCEIESAVVSDSDASAGAKVYAASSQLTDCVNWVTPDVRYVWTGAVSADFADAANWLVGGEPTAAAPDAEADVLIDAAECANKPVVSSETAVNSLVLVSGTLRVNGATEVSASVVAMAGSTLTVDQPLAVGGDFTALSGSALTHTKLPDTDSKSESYRFDVTVGGDMTIEKGVSVDLSSKGYSTGKGPGSYRGSSYYYASHGGGTYDFDKPYSPIVNCYDSIFAPTNSGSGGEGRKDHSGNSTYGGGAFVAKVAGHFQLDSDILVNVNGASDYFTGAGGAVFITAGTLAGAGGINANGGMVSSGNAGGGGRVSLVLTEPGATFDGYTGKVTAFGGSSTPSWSEPFDSKSARASCGTIYRQTGAQADGCGTIEIVNNPSAGDHYTDLGYGTEPDVKELKGAALEIGANARVRLRADQHVANLTLADNFGVLKLEGHTLRVHAAKPKHWEETEAALVKAGKIVLGEGGKIRWNEAGIAIIVR